MHIGMTRQLTTETLHIVIQLATCLTCSIRQVPDVTIANLLTASSLHSSYKSSRQKSTTVSITRGIMN